MRVGDTGFGGRILPTTSSSKRLVRRLFLRLLVVFNRSDPPSEAWHPDTVIWIQSYCYPARSSNRVHARRGPYAVLGALMQF